MVDKDLGKFFMKHAEDKEKIEYYNRRGKEAEMYIKEILGEIFVEIMLDIRKLLKDKGFEFRTFNTRNPLPGWKNKREFRIEKEDSSFLITIQKYKKLPPR